MKSIGIQGTKGSFSEIAAQEFAKKQHMDHMDDFAVKYMISYEMFYALSKIKKSTSVFLQWKMRKVAP
ncbi:type 2 periplasmic-binding domain-containing protein [Coxiella endosymbiont of Ornithodoros maritimus]|uniref:hypothetical protein n=1 Tax=Coxiella endosymbiont of Ornithodoros maritimus TaxID=1656172 RepID=UPI00226460B5|nr:hypothetical protein [Coxiella endosymbiont of Ornithodoros maritimus]